MQKLLKLQKIFLAQLVVLKYIYHMEFRAKVYLKQQSFSVSSKFQHSYANLCKNIKVTKYLLAQIVALKQIYKMQLRAKLYLKQQSFSAGFKSQKLLCTGYKWVTALDFAPHFTSCWPDRFCLIFSFPFLGLFYMRN